MTLIKVAVGGFTSDVGKTTLVCELLRALPGWEAIKTTRGHYRSCGKDPHACCVSHLLGEEPTVRSGRAETYARGKDTGRYWDAGASNVHWVVATDRQVERGIQLALERVEAEGVVIEGNSFTSYVGVDLFVMVARTDRPDPKPTARRALAKATAVYLSQPDDGESISRESVAAWREGAGRGCAELPVYTRETLPALVELVQGLRATKGAATSDALSGVGCVGSQVR